MYTEIIKIKYVTKIFLYILFWNKMSRNLGSVSTPLLTQCQLTLQTFSVTSFMNSLWEMRTLYMELYLDSCLYLPFCNSSCNYIILLNLESANFCLTPKIIYILAILYIKVYSYWNIITFITIKYILGLVWNISVLFQEFKLWMSRKVTSVCVVVIIYKQSNKGAVDSI